MARETKQTFRRQKKTGGDSVNLLMKSLPAMRVPARQDKTIQYLAVLFLPAIILIAALALWGLGTEPTGYAAAICTIDSDCRDTVEHRCRNGDVYKYTTLYNCVNGQCVRGDTEAGLTDTCTSDEECVDGQQQCMRKAGELPPLNADLIECDLLHRDERDTCLLQLAVKDEDPIVCNMIDSIDVKYLCYSQTQKTTGEPKTRGSDRIMCSEKEDCPAEEIRYECDLDGNVVKKTTTYYCAVYSGSYCMSREKTDVVDKCTQDEYCVDGVDHCRPL